jgi:5-methylcytosine-specific restriction endonuclease McrA
MININNIELVSNIKEYELDCPKCGNKFKTNRMIIKSAIHHKQKSIYCSKICANEGRKISKDELAKRITDFYKEYNRVPAFKDFNLSSIYRKKFGNWTNALEYAGFVKESDCRSRNKTRKTKSEYWKKQRNKYVEKKKFFVEQKGSKCEICGYGANLAALTFHHIYPDKKTTTLDARSMLNTSMEKLQEEINNCKLLCSNCHIEHHNPEHML